jgi:hypothetical protein
MSYDLQSHLDVRKYLALRMVYFEAIGKKRICDY